MSDTGLDRPFISTTTAVLVFVRYGTSSLSKIQKKNGFLPKYHVGFVFIFKKQIKSKMFTRSDRNFARKQLLECIRFQGLLVKQCIELNVMLDILWSAKYCMCLETLSLLIFYDNTHKHWQLLGVLESFCLSALKKKKNSKFLEW